MPILCAFMSVQRCKNALIAQLVERTAVNRDVDGSNPSWSAKIKFVKVFTNFMCAHIHSIVHVRYENVLQQYNYMKKNIKMFAHNK